MKQKLLLLLALIAIINLGTINGQTLYVPEATGTTPGLYKSANGNVGVGTMPRIELPQTNRNIFLGLSGGNVGIGTTSPQNKLDVNGTIHAREVKVDLTGWSDFVFHPTYQLKPLSEVEQYIKLNGHLEDIPSASEVEQGGENVGEMQTKLLQKVEELTLYVIELKSENEQLKNEKEKHQEVMTIILKEMNALKLTII